MMPLPICRHCSTFIEPSLADNKAWLDSDRSAVCADLQHLHAPSTITAS